MLVSKSYDWCLRVLSMRTTGVYVLVSKSYDWCLRVLSMRTTGVYVLVSKSYYFNTFCVNQNYSSLFVTNNILWNKLSLITRICELISIIYNIYGIEPYPIWR